MDIQKLIELLSNHLCFLFGQKATQEVLGNVNEILSIDEKIQETETTLTQLRSLV